MREPRNLKSGASSGPPSPSADRWVGPQNRICASHSLFAESQPDGALMEKVGDTLQEKILIVQNSPSYLATTPDFLSTSGYSTAVVQQRTRALEKVGQESPDLVIFDLGSVTSADLELLAQLKSDRFTQHIPIIILGSASPSADAAHWIDSGADDYLDYPYHLPVLHAHVRALLRRSFMYDPVTHLPAGTYLKRQVDAWLSKNVPTAVLYVDIDHFASYNSAYGRAAGDRVLQYLARLIVDALPHGNLSVGHLGEDDFMMAFPPPGTDTIARTLVERFKTGQKEFYNELDLAKQYVPELDPSLPPHNWPLMTLSAAVVTNQEQALINFLQVSSALSRQMARIKASRSAPELIREQVPAQDEIYPNLLKEGHRHFHQRIGEQIEEANSKGLDQYAPLLGYHFSEAGDYARAARYFQMAGDKAQSLFAPEEARQHYEKALEALGHLPSTSEHLRLRTEVATRRAAAAFGTDPPDQILTSLANVDSLADSLQNKNGPTERNDRITILRVHIWIGRLLAITDRAPEAIESFHRMLVELQNRGEEEVTAVPTGEIGLTMARQGYFGKAIPFLRRGIDFFAKIADWQRWTYLAGFLAMSLVASGQVTDGLAEAESIMRRAKDLKSNSAIALAHLFYAFAYLLAGDPGRSLTSSTACVSLASGTGDLLFTHMAYGLQACALSRLGRLAAAQVSLMRQEESARRLGGRVALPDQSAALAAEVALRQGDAASALALAQQAVTLAKEMNGVFAEGLAEVVWAKALAAKTPWRYEESEQHLLSAIKALESGECLVEAARTREVWGLLASAAERGATARDLLGTAASQFESAGLVREAVEAQEIIAALTT
jgi:diguanylate cyclase (GGDEF)-like protein